MAPVAPGQAGPAQSELDMRRDPMAWAIAILATVVAIIAVWWASGLGDRSLSSRALGELSPPGGLIVILMALRLRRTGRLDARVRRAWSFIGIGLAVYGLGFGAHFIAGSAPSAGLLDPLSIGLKAACYPLISIGFSCLPRPARTRYDLILFSLDVTIAAASAAILLWYFSIYPATQVAHRDMIFAVQTAFFPVYDAALVFSIVALVIRGLPRSTRTAMTIAGVAITSIFAADLIAGLEIVAGTYTPGGISGFFYSTAWVWLAIAAYAHLKIRDPDGATGGLADYAGSSFPWLPYAAVAAALFAPAIRDWDDINMLRQLVPATGVLIALVIARLGVTARHNASLAIEERERLAAAVDQAAEAILTTDRHENVTYVNPAFTRIIGYSAAEVLGKSVHNLDESADPTRLAEMGAALARGESWEGRLQQCRRDGTIVELDMAIAPLRDAAGAVVGSVSVSRDVSRERALESQLAQMQRMEAIGRLAGGVAHDFNNILTVIGGFGELAAAELGSDHPVTGHVDQILRASDRAAALTRSLLTFANRQATQSRITDLNEAVTGLTPMLGRLIGEDVHLVVRVDPALGLVMADGAQIEQVVLNLAVNARDAMPDGGTLTISTANADLDAGFARSHVGAGPGKYVVLVVSDTGVGMTPEVMEHAFEPFYTTKQRGKGTGLGLSTVFAIAQQFGGFVRVESRPGAGSAFSVYLPRLEGATRPTEIAGVADRPRGGRETILVAEDENEVRHFVERVLAGAGYEVRSAANGAEAIDLAGQMPNLHLLVTDVVMPGMSGVQLAAHLTKARSDLPVIYASGYSEEGVPRAAGDGQGASYLPKPFTAEKLLRQVREALDRRASAGASAPSGDQPVA